MVTILSLGIFFFFISFLEYISNSRKTITIGTWLILFGCLFLSTIRNGIFGDYDHYKEIWTYTDWNAVLGKAYKTYEVQSSEPLYKLLNYVCHSLVDNFNFFLFIESLIVNVCIIILAEDIIDTKEKRLESNYVSCCSVVLTMFYCMGLFNVIVVRQALSVGLCLCSIKFIREKKPIPFLVLTVLAILIHRSAILWLIAYFIYHIHISNIRNYMMIWCALAVCIIGAGIVLPILAQYVPGIAGAKLRLYISMGLDSYGSGVSVATTLLKSSVNIIFIMAIGIWQQKYYTDSEDYQGYFNLYMFSAAISIASVGVSNQFARLATPFAMTSVAIILYLLSARFTNFLSKVMSFWVIAAYFFMRLVMSTTSIRTLGFDTILGRII